MQRDRPRQLGIGGLAAPHHLLDPFPVPGWIVLKQEGREAERIVHERMGDAATLSVPLDVQIGRGGDWNEAGH